MTLAEKIIARAAAVEEVQPGDMVTVGVDLAFAHDSSGPRRWAPMLDELKAGIWNPDCVAIVLDHYVPAVDPMSAEILKFCRMFAAQHGITNFFDMVGICHLVLPERGLIRPGTMIAGGDSHTPMAGAFGAYAAGYGATDMVGILVTGKTWMAVPETIRINLTGRPATGVAAKDIMLMLCRRLGPDNAFKVFEYEGPAVDAMTMSERMVLCNMTAELGGETGIMAPDETTFAYLTAAGRPAEDEPALRTLRSDAGAGFAAEHRIDVDAIEPQIAAPHHPGNTTDISLVAGTRIDQAYIGACVGAKLEDLRMAAAVLKGRKVASGVRLLVAPASQQTTARAADDGTLATLLAAGAIILPSGCGACAGMGAGLLAEAEVCISSTNRNFRGRMGANTAEVYLGSPYSVAAAAVAGHIVDPRDLLAQKCSP